MLSRDSQGRNATKNPMTVIEIAASDPLIPTSQLTVGEAPWIRRQSKSVEQKVHYPYRLPEQFHGRR